MIKISRRFFLTGLAAGIAAPLIVPRSSLMAMPRAPSGLILPKPGLITVEDIKTFGGAMWNGKYFPTVQDAMEAVMSYVTKETLEKGLDKGLLTQQSIEVYQSGSAWHPGINKWNSPEQAGSFANGDTIHIHPRGTPFEHASPFKTRGDDGGFA